MYDVYIRTCVYIIEKQFHIVCIFPHVSSTYMLCPSEVFKCIITLVMDLVLFSVTVVGSLRCTRESPQWVSKEEFPLVRRLVFN